MNGLASFHVRHRKFLSLAIIFSLLPLSGCIVTYSKYPKHQQFDPAKKYERLCFQIEGVTVAGGLAALEDTLKEQSPFREVSEVKEPPAEGWFLKVRIFNIPPSIPSVVFGYLSLATLTISPVWSTTGGTNLFYELNYNGKLIRTYDYRVRRQAFLWIVLLPFIWVNLLTPSEQKAFQATALQFFKDADPQIVLAAGGGN